MLTVALARGRSGGEAARAGDEDVPTTYSRKVGDRLRTIRRQKRLSLQDVETASGHEFKASVLGAYERGERSISVPRLQRLSEFYDVPVDQLLPGTQGRPAPSPRRSPGDRLVTIDLRRAQALAGPEGELLKRYLAAIQVQRQDFNGRILTVRSDDLHTLSCLFGVAAERVQQRMVELRLIVED